LAAVGAVVRQRYRKLRRSSGMPRGFPPPTTLIVIQRLAREHALDPRLAPTDRHMQRWAGSQGSGLPVDPDDADGLPRTRLPILPPDEAVITDQIVLGSPSMWQRFIFAWYRSPKPKEVIAEELGMRVQAVYDERRLVLAYMLGRLTEAGIVLPSMLRNW
jgi:hypothetical protein